MTMNNYYNPTVSAFNATGVKDVLDQHAELFTSMLLRTLRKRSLA